MFYFFRLLLLIAILFLFSNPAWAEKQKPFLLGMRYKMKEQMLRVDVRRNIKDETKYAIKKIIVSKNDEVVLEENLSKENYRNEITKKIPLAAQEEDVIKVVLHYGEDQMYEKQLTIAAVDQDNDAAEIKKAQSVLVADQSAVASLEDQESIIKKDKEVIILQSQELDRAAYGYEIEEENKKSEAYGYSLDENEDYKGAEVDTTPYGYEVKKDKEYGLKDVGHKKSDEKVFGYKGNDSKGEENFFGRKTYESNKLFKKE